MDQSTPTGQTAPASTPPSNQGSEIAQTNPFEATPPATTESSSQVPQQNQTPETQQPQQTPSTQPSTQPSQQTPPATPAFDPQALTKSVVESVIAAQQAIQQQAAPQTQQQPAPMSPEEFRKHYQIPVVDDAVYEAILGVAPDKPERAAALDNLMQGFLRAGVLMGQDLLKAQLGQFESRFTNQISPLLAAHQQAQEAAIINEFQAANPDLKDYMAVVTEVRDAMIARGTKFSSKEEMFKQVGEATRQVLNRVRGTPAGGSSQQPSSVPNSPKPRTMTPAATGGRGGSASSTPKSTAEAIFGT